MTRFQVLVVGAGPAGLAAAIEAATAGATALVIDENSAPGGQLFKQIHKFFGSSAHYAGIRGLDIGRKMLDEAQSCGVEIWLDSTVWGLFPDNHVAVIRDECSMLIEAEKVILATGAYENALSFPGWTLPGVITAGSLQTMMNVQRVLPAERMLMVGAGNIGLIVSYQAMQAGMDVVAVIEARDRIGGYAVHAAKIRRYGVPILTSHTISEAHGAEQVESATLVQLDDRFLPVEHTERRIGVDMICLAVGLTPMAELAWMAGCQFAYVPEAGGHVPIHDENMETTVPGLYVAGDITGIEEANTAIDEGRLAGIAAAEALGYCSAAEASGRKALVCERLDELRLGEINRTRRTVQKILQAQSSGVRQELSDVSPQCGRSRIR
jgi:thioredoxin reductase